jgi:hypothetical protein
MSTINIDRELTQSNELRDDELDAVSGGITCASGRHFDEATIDVGGGGSGATPASAWNACLNGYGFPSMA